MPANAAIYIQQGSGDIAKVFDNVRSNKRLFRDPTWYDVQLGDDIVRFNVMDSNDVQSHIKGLLRYIASLNHDEARKKDTAYAISHTTVVLGLVTDREFEENHMIWQSLFRIAGAYDGFVFVHNSLLLPSGTVLVGPLLD